MTTQLERKIAELRHQVDGLLAWRKGSSIVACRVYDDAAQTLTSSGTLYAVDFAHESWDTHKMHDTSTNNSRVYIPVSGWYQISGNVSFAANATGARTVGLRVDGSTYIAITRTQTDASLTVPVNVNTTYYCTAGQYIEVMAQQHSGGSLNTSVASGQEPYLSVARIG